MTDKNLHQSRASPIGPLMKDNKPTRCSSCGSTWGYVDMFVPDGDPHVLVGLRVYKPRRVICGQCGRELE